MRKTMLRNRIGIVLLILGIVIAAATGCSQQSTAQVAEATTEAAAYTRALRTDYENALDVTSQLALGILRLEDTTNAVTAEQATQALPLWKILQGNTVKTESERFTIAKQIEDTLNDTQVATIVAMQLTQADEQAWLQEQGPAMSGGAPQGTGTDQGTGTGRFGGAGQNMADTSRLSEEERAAMREQFANMTDEERANMRSQFTQSGGSAPAGAPAGANAWASTALMRAVVNLLSERSGQAVAAVVTQPAEAQSTSTTEPVATATPATVATSTPEVEANIPVTIITLVPWSTPEPEAIATPTPATAQAATTNMSTSAQTSVSTAATVQTVAQVQTTTQGALVQKLDTDPGPPLTVEITTNYAEANPLLEGSLIYRIGGFIYNPTDETYDVTAVQVTFFDASGFRGAFYAFPMRPGQRGIQGEWIWHGAMEADVSCTVLGPGESCPFTAEIAGQDMASFLVHPDAKVAEWHESVAVTLSDVKVSDTGVGYVLISGTVNNANPYPVKNIVVSGLLLDGSGQIVSMGAGTVAGIEANGSAGFTVYVEKQAYASYQLTVRAEQDAK